MKLTLIAAVIGTLTLAGAAAIAQGANRNVATLAWLVMPADAKSEVGVPDSARQAGTDGGESQADAAKSSASKDRDEEDDDDDDDGARKQDPVSAAATSGDVSTSIAAADSVAGAMPDAHPLRIVPNEAYVGQNGFGWRYFVDVEDGRGLAISPQGGYWYNDGTGTRLIAQAPESARAAL